MRKPRQEPTKRKTVHKDTRDLKLSKSEGPRLQKGPSLCKCSTSLQRFHRDTTKNVSTQNKQTIPEKSRKWNLYIILTCIEDCESRKLSPVASQQTQKTDNPLKNNQHLHYVLQIFLANALLIWPKLRVFFLMKSFWRAPQNNMHHMLIPIKTIVKVRWEVLASSYRLNILHKLNIHFLKKRNKHNILRIPWNHFN